MLVEMSSVLWIRAEHEVRERLSEADDVELVWSEGGLEIQAPAFTVRMTEESGEVLVWAGDYYHEHFGDPEAAANFLCWLLTPYYRLVEDCQGERVLQANIERFMDGVWQTKAGGPVYVPAGSQERADRRVISQHAVLSPGPMPNIDPWLDAEGLPPDSELGRHHVEVDLLVGLNEADFNVVALLQDDDPMFGDLLETLYDQEGPYDLVADEHGFEVRPHGPGTFPLRVERAEAENRLIAFGITIVGDAMEISGLATLLLGGFARVVEEYAGSRRKSVALQLYGPEGWTDHRGMPVYDSWLWRLFPTSERRYWQQRVEIGLQIQPQGEVDLDDQGWPRGSRWGCHIE